MKSSVTLALLVLASAQLRAQTPADRARWQREAAHVTIIRDDWGIAHVYGTTDADAVFGMIYAQAEDDFNRVETNYLTALGRMAEAEGPARIWQDLRQRLYVDPDTLRAAYRRSPAWLRGLMDAWADGLNFYLATHPNVHPRVLTRFAPWMALSFTEGSIGGDIERINLRELAAFYGGQAAGTAPRRGDGPGEEPLREPGGSNGAAIAPANTRDHHALFLINPHTSFFFRSELQMVSAQGLDAYGAVTWGQFFIYQGFNARIGWMHTSSGVDNIDEFLETVSRRHGRWSYEHGGREYPMITDTVQLRYATPAGLRDTTFTIYKTRHGPIERKIGDRWVSISLMDNPVNALIQSYSRTKARNLAEFRRLLELHTNSSNNTVYADADGHIAYFHSNYIPRRDTAFDWTQPVDGSNPATDYHGLLSVDETPHLLDPASGWLYNSNNAPWWAAGPNSPKEDDFPVYVETGGESARGRHAERVLSASHDFTLDSFRAAAFDPALPWFETTLPVLFRAYDALPADDSLRARLADQVAALRGWDVRWSAASVPTTLAVFWGTELYRAHTRAMRTAGLGRAAIAGGMGVEEWAATRATPAELLGALDAASDSIAHGFGTWRTAWGDVNRFQRINDDIDATFTDSGPSIPVPFTSSLWGSLASFGAHAYPGTNRWYGTSGNSFVAVVEFGDSVRARAITAGGESGDPQSPHFDDEAARYASGDLRDVYFYRSQLTGHTERTYHPGE